MNRRKFVVLSLASLGLTALSNPLLAAERIFTGLLPGVGIGGYDAVAYFTQNEAVKGDAAFSTQYEGADWHFSSQENLDLFVANPQKYAPQYGGYCAFAASKGALAKGDPKAWTIYEDKLYLNFSLSVRDIWQQDIVGNNKKADANFENLLATWPDVTQW